MVRPFFLMPEGFAFSNSEKILRKSPPTPNKKQEIWYNTKKILLLVQIL